MKNESVDGDRFDWRSYDGYNGGSRLSINRGVRVSHPHERVYSHEPYAQALYDMYEAGGFPERCVSKEMTPDTIMKAVDVAVVSDHELSLDSGVASYVVDMNHEKQWMGVFGFSKVSDFFEYLKDYKKEMLDYGIVGKIVAKNRISLWEGHLDALKDEFRSQIDKPTQAYTAHVKEINRGGYIVDVNGVQCFMPGSLAAAGVIADFDSLVGKDVIVMVENYTPGNGFVVSNKKYINYMMDSMIRELEVGQPVHCKVTGIQRFGIFVQFPNSKGEDVFTGLFHKDAMSSDFRRRFNVGDVKIGDAVDLLIFDIQTDNHNRIVLTDIPFRHNEINNEDE